MPSELTAHIEARPEAVDLQRYSARDQAILSLVKTYKNHPLMSGALVKYRKLDRTINPAGDLVGRYLQEISQYRLLDSADEFELFTLIDKGLVTHQSLNDSQPATPDQEQALFNLTFAHEAVYLSNLRLVVSIAKQYSKFATMVPFIDMIQEGNVGLGKAIRRFEIDRGHKFSTYSTFWIRQNITRALGDHGRTIRLPTHLHEVWIKINKARRNLEVSLGREPTTEELAEATYLEPNRVEEIRRVGKASLISLNALVGDDADTEIGDLEPGSPGIDNRIEEISDKQEVQEIFKSRSLSPKEKTILSLRFGTYADVLKGATLQTPWGTESYDVIFERVPDGAGLTLEEVSEIFGLTRERIRQIEAKALSRLRGDY